MGTKLYFHDLHGPPRSSPWTPWGSMDPRLRTYALGTIALFLFFRFRFSFSKYLDNTNNLYSEYVCDEKM